MGGLFEGQGGFVLCALQCGIKPLWSSEIEPHAVAVLRKHFGDEEMGIEGDWRNYLCGDAMQIISLRGVVKCRTMIPYPEEVVKLMRKAGYSVRNVPDKPEKKEKQKNGLHRSET